MARLVLGPMLRYLGSSEATIWVEVDRPCQITIRAGDVSATASSFGVDGRHYALLSLLGLDPGSCCEYSVAIDGEQAWPERESEFPASVISTPEEGSASARVAFGSCRVSLPHHPPFVLDQDEDRRGHGIDALRAYAFRAGRRPADALPDCLLLLGDQIYADQLSPRMQEAIESREETDLEGELGDFEEYALAYHEAWSEPPIRWLLSTVATAMIFDDHEVHAQWKISHEWLEEMRSKPWYDPHLSAALMAYWIYQHIGNLSPAELDGDELFTQVRDSTDAGPMLREEMVNADRQAGHSRWSHSRDIGRIRIILIDSRAGRELDENHRQMIDDEEWAWVVDQAGGEFEHLVLASSVPFFLTPGLHHFEAFGEAITDGAWGSRIARAGERLRRFTVMDHWAAFGQSFPKVEDLIEAVATGALGERPASLVMLSGDVHHCYLAKIELPASAREYSPIWQAVSSAYRKQLAPKEKRSMRIGNSRLGAILGRALARAAGAPPPRLSWRIVHDPCYDNQIGTLELEPGRSRVRIESTAEADWRRPTLSSVFSEELTSGSS